MRKGERFIKDIYEALRSGPKWQNTMLFIGYGAAPLCSAGLAMTPFLNVSAVGGR